MKSRNVVYYIVFAALMVFAGSCVAKKNGPERLPAYRAKTIVLKEEKCKEELASFGTIAFKTKIEVCATVEGTLVDLPVAEGSAVEAGALLARLGNVQLEMRQRQSQAAVASATSSLELARAKLWEGELQVEARVETVAKARIQLSQKEYEVAELESSYAKKQSLLAIGGATPEDANSLLISLNAQKSALAAQRKDLEIQEIGLRDEDLRERGLPVPNTETARRDAIRRLSTRTLAAEVDVAASQLESASMDLASVVEMLGQLELRAPASGLVGALYAEKGEHLQQNAKVMTLMNTDAVYAVLPVQEADASRIKEGMPVALSVDAYPGRSFEARVALISPIVDSQTGAVTVKASLRNPEPRLSPGMFARARIDLGSSRMAIKLPSSAIAQKKGSTAEVFVLVNGNAFLKEATLGQEADGAFIVEKGFRGGEIVIDSPSPLLKEGEVVETEI